MDPFCNDDRMSCQYIFTEQQQHQFQFQQMPLPFLSRSNNHNDDEDDDDEDDEDENDDEGDDNPILPGRPWPANQQWNQVQTTTSLCKRSAPFCFYSFFGSVPLFIIFLHIGRLLSEEVLKGHYQGCVSYEEVL